MFEELNESQRRAVYEEKGPLLILAGAGSGKTKTLTSRICRLIKEEGVYASSILAITFTNKAANEMKERLYEYIQESSRGIWMGTFHSIALRILRKHADLIGFSTNFSIYDTSDQRTVVKAVLSDLNISKDYINDKQAHHAISQVKTKIIGSTDYEQFIEADYKQIYEEYMKRLRENQAMDFDDILINLCILFHREPKLLSEYQDRFYEILVDEYQDTNRAQYEIIRLLSQKKGNLVVVGDDNQSIYGWRGADIRNIMNFQSDFPNAKIIKLEQNYRSTANILGASNALIQNNTAQHKKELWTQGEEGEALTVLQLESDREEARYVVQQIQERLNKGVRASEIAILYRTHSLSRVLEESLRQSNIAYQMVGGLKFFDRMEIKDILAYARLVNNTSDDIAFLRVINTPRRGIGKKTIEDLQRYASEHQKPLFHALQELCRTRAFSSAVQKKIESFIQLIGSVSPEESAFYVVKKLYEDSGYEQMLLSKKTLENQTRIDNISELFNDIKEAEKDAFSLAEYIEGITLQSDVDTMHEEDEAVTMMTLHSSKGLEFDVVFLAGMDENIFPSFMALESDQGIEEERRLCYVGMTRAKKKLYLLGARARLRFGRFENYQSSCFIDEIPSKFIEATQPKKAKAIFQKPQTIENHNLSPGKRVSHAVFGEGVIVGYKEQERTIDVSFEKAGIKKLHLDFAPLRLVKK